MNKFSGNIIFPDVSYSFVYMSTQVKFMGDNFNGFVKLPNGLKNCANIFYGCDNFNQPVSIPESVTNCVNMFFQCYNFNQPVNIPKGVTSCVSMFQYCHNLNQPINIQNNVTNCANMFEGCYNFNQPINIPNKVINCARMFLACSNFAYSVRFPASVNNCHYALFNCLKVPDIYITKESDVNVVGLVKGHERATMNINIHCPNLAIINSYYSRESVTGSFIYWDENLYNATYKIQLTTDMN